MTFAKFKLGRLFSTPGVSREIPSGDILQAIARHSRGDWGNVCEEDREENELSLREGFRLVSVYESSAGQRFWVITEADRESTTVLLPEEY